MRANVAHGRYSSICRFLKVLGLITAAPALLAAADGSGVLKGTLTDSAGAPVAFAMVTASRIGTDEVRPAATWTDGSYRLDLPPGNYRVRFDSAGYKPVEIASAIVDGAWTAVINGRLGDDEQSQGTPAAPPPQNPAPSTSPTAPSLEDLGISSTQARGDAKTQALLDRRTHMLKIHQRLGLITIAPLAATLISSVGAGGRQTSRGSRDLHLALGAATGDLYFTTAYFAIRAPRIPGTPTRGPIRVHKAMAWIHGPGMILTPILGAIAFDQKSKGEHVHGIASLHGPVAIVTAGAFGVAVMSVSFKF